MKLDTDKILAITAMVIGIASLVVVVYQTQLQRESAEAERRAQAASVLPYLMVVTTMNNEGVFLNLRNTGTGPARIDRVRVLHRGGEFSGDAVDFYIKMRSDPQMGFDIDQIKPGRLVPAGEWIRMLGTGNSASRDKMLAELLRLFDIAELQQTMYQEYDKRVSEGKLLSREKGVLEVTYSSVFGERWMLRSDNMVPQPK
jgi:hypothetical protein